MQPATFTTDGSTDYAIYNL